MRVSVSVRVRLENNCFSGSPEVSWAPLQGWRQQWP